MFRHAEQEWEPALGYDTTQRVEVHVTENPDGSRSAILLPSSVRRLTPEQFAVAHRAQRIALNIQREREELDELALEMRDLGVSWGAIGWSVGLTGEAARRRWGDDA